MDLDKLSYKAYGNLVIVVLLFIALLFNLFPFSFIGFIQCVIEIPIYLLVRNKFEKPIHANGLNICFFLTILFYCFLFLTIKLGYKLLPEDVSFGFSTLLCILGCYTTSTLPDDIIKKGKLFFGRKSENGKYADLFRVIKFEPNNKIICDYERRMKEDDPYVYTIFKGIFRDGKTWDEVMELAGIWERKELDKEIYAIYKTLQYALNLRRLD